MTFRPHRVVICPGQINQWYPEVSNVNKKDRKALVAYAESLGYSLHRSSKHLVFRLPGTKAQVTASSTASDHRARLNIMGDLRREQRLALAV